MRIAGKWRITEMDVWDQDWIARASRHNQGYAVLLVGQVRAGSGRQPNKVSG